MAALWVSPDDSRRLAAAESVVFLVGGYDGSGNFGDVLQVATAIETVLNLPGSPLAVAIVERQWNAHHTELARRYPERLGAAAFAFFDEGEATAHDGFLELQPGAAPAKSLVYVYGGGHLNGWWGARKAAYAAAADRLAGGGPLPVVASGLQVDAAGIAPGGPAHELLSRASWIGVRDIGSLECVRRHIPGATDRAHLTGDDAVPFLLPRPARAEPTVNFHLNDGSWVSDEPTSMKRTAVDLMCALGPAAGKRLALQPVIAYEDPRISERRILSALLEQESSRLEANGLAPAEPLEILDDAIDNELARFRRARLTVSCSYHVALSSLLAAIPTVLIAQNDYYRQKAGGLRDLLQLDESLVGVRGTAADASAAVEALVDGPSRSALVAHLQVQSRQVVQRYNRGRAGLSAALAQGLAQRGGEARVARVRRGVRRLATRVGIRKSHPGAQSDPSPTQLLDEIGRIEALAQQGLAQADYALAVARDMSLPTKLLAFMSWLELHPPTTGPLISVILPTCDRPKLLDRAIRSVIAQRYDRWELVIVDDGRHAGVDDVADRIADDRVLFVEGDRRGPGSGRNRGLDRATGEIVCYLDDDNVMHPVWLHAVSHVFSTREDVDVAYGVSIAEHRVPGELGEHGWWPSFWQLPWSRETLAKENVTDIGALAHRSELDGARFDEELVSCEDWDLLLRLTAHRDALAVPALSHAYSMSAANRMSDHPRFRAGLEEIRLRYS